MKKKFPPPFEKLKFAEDYGHYQVSLEHRGYTLTCCFLADDEETLTCLLPYVLAFWNKRAAFFKAFREFAAVDLLEELNNTNDCRQAGFRPATSAQIRKALPAPFSVRFGFNGDLDDFFFEMAGGEDETVLQDRVFSVYGTLDKGIEFGEVDSMT